MTAWSPRTRLEQIIVSRQVPVSQRALVGWSVHQSTACFTGHVIRRYFGRGDFVFGSAAAFVHVGSELGSLRTASSLSNRMAYAVPDLIFKSDQRRRRQGRRWLRSLGTINDQSGDIDFAVRIIRIAFSISTEQCRTRSGNLEECLDHSCL